MLVRSALWPNMLQLLTRRNDKATLRITPIVVSSRWKGGALASLSFYSNNDLLMKQNGNTGDGVENHRITSDEDIHI